MHATETAFSTREIKVGRRAIGVYVAVAVLAIAAARILPMTGWFTDQPAPMPASPDIAEAQPLSDIG